MENLNGDLLEELEDLTGESINEDLSDSEGSANNTNMSHLGKREDFQTLESETPLEKMFKKVLDN